MSDFNSNDNVPTTSDVSGDSLVDDVRRELEEIDGAELSEHAARFAALHEKLDQSLRSIDNL